MNLSAGYLKIFDDYFYLSGWLVGNTYAGHWDREGATRPLAVGTFTAVKQNAAGRLPPPDPSGVWEYEARTAGGGSTGFLVITGALSFATSPNSTAGNWLFDKVVTDPPRPTAHPVGQGSFTNAVISTNTLSISMHAQDGSLKLEGEMVGDFYAGFWRWSAPDESEYGFFNGRRKRTE